ncbi:FMN-binding negative transcriptional regulator [uncultured Paludibaculum sp.]|uniref:FMN-binding negative transcriptional regulator n=1 Tax=uncultured Paludibaculum sp. TaxID=1765020 RepID=UPI002AAB465E|nr:FMN-binding negative transcriptional regulator [uncultured Paludibaculum sp.]
MPKRREFLAGLPALAWEPVPDASVPQDTIYIPNPQREIDRALILDFLEEFSFAMLVTARGGVHITNVPTLFDRAPQGWGKLWWHLARNNAQNQVFDGATDCTVVFHGPHGYISPNWYATRNSVPTWNFAAVHATGKPKRLDDDTGFAKSLERLVARNEGLYGGGGDYDFSKLPETYLKGMRQGIVAYEMEISQIEAKFKLGQDRSARDRAGILKGLKSGRRERNLEQFTESYYSRLKE